MGIYGCQFELYPIISLSGEEEYEVRDTMPHFMFYRRLKEGIDIYCTACHQREIVEKNAFGYSAHKLGHKEKGICPICGEAVTFMSMGYGRKTLHRYANYVFIRDEGENQVCIECCGVRLNFEDDDMEPQLDAREKAIYYLSPGDVTRYVSHWCWGVGPDFKEVMKINEPHFYSLWCGGWTDNRYYTVGLDKLEDTFLKYALKGMPQIPERLVSYLCRYALHPNIEYLYKGGFEELGNAVVEGGYGVRINWRSDNLQKMLRLDKYELNSLKGCSAVEYNSYIVIRRELPGVKTEKIFDYWRIFGSRINYLQDIKRMSGLSFKDTISYVEKQSKKSETSLSNTLIAYKDYLHDCTLLDYKMHGTVLFPKNLFEAHDRTARAIIIENDKKAAEQLEKADSQRSWLPYLDKERGLAVVLPRAISEIVEEGRALEHCVASYAERHAKGVLHIVFLRKLSEPLKPYYTIEVSTDGRIVQCRGFANNVVRNGGTPKPQEIIDFEKDYQKYLIEALAESKRKKHKKARKSA